MSFYIKHKVNWMEVCNIKLPNWMQKLQLSVCRKSLFWDWFQLTYSVWRSGYVGFFIGFWYRALTHWVQRSFQSYRTITRNRVIYSLGYLKFTTDSHWQWKKRIKKSDHRGISIIYPSFASSHRVALIYHWNIIF